jgi:hypothetical protein
MATSVGLAVWRRVPVARSDPVSAIGAIPSSSFANTRCALKPVVETLAKLFATTSCLRSQYRRALAALVIPLSRALRARGTGGDGRRATGDGELRARRQRQGGRERGTAHCHFDAVCKGNPHALRTQP